MKIDAGWLHGDDVSCLVSPHCDDRPDAQDISLLVVHNISLPAGCFGRSYIEALFMGMLDCHVHPDFADLAGLRVSAHVLVRREGEVVQFVPFHHRAWHAGVSTYQGRSGCNDFSIGIELEGTDTWVYTYAQYQRLAEIAALLCQHYPMLSPQHIVGHSDIAPDRKTDPGEAFDWVHFGRVLADCLDTSEIVK